MLLQRNTIWDCWKAINEEFIFGSPAGAAVFPGRDFSFVRYDVTLHATNGFGVPNSFRLPDGTTKAHIPLFPGQKRLDMLANRYIYPPFWDEAIARMAAKKVGSKQPSSFLLQFYRRETVERKVPSGGGCLVGINFTWFEKAWHVHILSRASEITARLASDIYFADQCVRKVVKEASLRHWDPKNLDIRWTLLLPSQMKYMTPLYLLLNYGDRVVEEYMGMPAENDWQRIVQEHFWTTVIYPERISWAQRRKWAEKFLSWSNIDWPNHHINPEYPKE